MDSSSSTDSELSSSSSTSSDDFDEYLMFLKDFDPANIKPYQFEPLKSKSDQEKSSGEESEMEEQEDLSRLANSNWCTCDNCQIMDRREECICCQEIKEVININSNAVSEGDINEAPTCITQHPGFLAVCTNKWVLRTAWFQYKQQYQGSYEGPEHKQLRHIAYRQLVRWCWGTLGKKVRVVLPSCAVMCIRQHFPPPSLEEDFEIQDLQYADE